jgi:urease alpha subunit
MDRFDLVIRGGTVATACETMNADIGIRDGRVVALGQGLAGGRDEIDAGGLLVLPAASMPIATSTSRWATDCAWPTTSAPGPARQHAAGPPR